MIPLNGPYSATEATPTASGAARRSAVDDRSVSLTFKPALASRAAASDPVQLAASLAELVDCVAGSNDDRSAWQTISGIAATLITGAEQAGVVGYGDQRQAGDLCDGATGNVRLLMKAQEDTGEGPCLDAARTGEQVLVHDLRSDARWPQFTPRTPWQIHSMLCTPIAVGGGSVAVLTVVSARAWAFDDGSVRLATVVAAHAALALNLLHRIRNLRAMVDSREVIGQATGIIMQRHQVSAEQAFHVLARTSQERNLKLRTLAGQIADAVAAPDNQPRTSTTS